MTTPVVTLASIIPSINKQLNNKDMQKWFGKCLETAGYTKDDMNIIPFFTYVVDHPEDFIKKLPKSWKVPATLKNGIKSLCAAIDTPEIKTALGDKYNKVKEAYQDLMKNLDTQAKEKKKKEQESNEEDEYEDEYEENGDEEDDDDGSEENMRPKIIIQDELDLLFENKQLRCELEILKKKLSHLYEKYTILKKSHQAMLKIM
jgi:hypothetical protein